MEAGDEVPLLAEDLHRAPSHPGHDSHRGSDVGRISELHADVCDVRAKRAHRERNDVEGAPAHRALEEVLEHLAHLLGIAPVVRGTGLLSLLGADEGAVLDARDVARVGASEIRVRALGVGELLEGPPVDQLLTQAVVLLRGAVAPVDLLGVGQPGKPLDPVDQLVVLAYGGRRGRLAAQGGNQLLSGVWNGKRPGNRSWTCTHSFAPRGVTAQKAR